MTARGANKVGNVITFLRNKEGRRHGLPITNVTITVKYTQPEVIAYSDAELHDLLRVSNDDQKLLWTAFLETGYCEQEMSVSSSMISMTNARSCK